MRDEDTRSFIESDFGYQPTPRPSKRKGSGFSLLKRGVPDEDEQLQRARFELTKLEGQFFDAAKAVDKLARVRKGDCNVFSPMSRALLISCAAPDRFIRHGSGTGQQTHQRRLD